MPSKAKIEEELSLYMNEKLPSCSENFTNFPELKISQDKILTQTKIEKGNVIFDVSYPLSITKSTRNYLYSDFNGIAIPVRLDVIYDFITDFMKTQMQDKSSICISCLYNSTFQKDLYLEMGKKNDTVIYNIIDKNSKIKGGDYNFNLAIQYKNETL